MQSSLVAALAFCCVAYASGFSLGGFIAPMQATSPACSKVFQHSAPFVSRLREAGLTAGRRARLQSGITGLRAAGIYNEEEKPKAQKELLQIRFAKSDPNALKAFVQKWPAGTKKDNFGLPKLMLPVSHETKPAGVKIIFKGSIDPWMQIELEGDTVRVFRCTGLSTTSLQVSALKEREEQKICQKLKEDMANFGEGMEKEIPKVEPIKEAPKEEAAEAKAEDNKPAAPPA